ncbi:hypothetical protein CcaverHIS002_0113490 [Cutaneotrichosporon cavernicola]|nr:hypothetical protein CcaverHIS002_0113490 [Cutaneotrichosporon cavernicola]
MFELPPKRKRGRSPGAEVRPRGAHKRGKRIVSLLATLQRGDEPEGDPHAASLLGVPGLTRQALDACVAAFFGSTRHTVRVSQPADLFARRVRVMLYETAGLEVPKDLMGIEAAGEFLALAISALGAPASPYPQLEGALRERCLELATDAEYLANAGLDAVEAANLIAEGPYPIGISHLCESNPLVLDPLGLGYPVELAVYHNVHIQPVGGDHVRREAVFWSVWAGDALRSTCVGIQAAMADTDLDVLAKGTNFDLARLRAADNPEMMTLPATMAMLAARNLLYVVCWAAAKCDAIQHPRNLASRMVDEVEAAAMRGAQYMVSLAHTIVESKLPVPVVVSSRLVSVVVFLVHRVLENTQKGRPERNLEPVGNADALINAIEGMECYADTASVAVALRDALARAEGPDAQPALVPDLVTMLLQHNIQTPFSALEI